MRQEASVHGFTLVEATVVVGIIAILATVGYQSLKAVNDRAQFASRVNNLVAQLENLRSQSFGRGVPTVLVVDKLNHRYWALVDRDADFDLGSFDPSNPQDSGSDVLLERVVLDRSVRFAGRYGAAKLPSPYSWVPIDDPCTFCNANGLGAVIFNGDGTARITGANEAGGSLTVTRLAAEGRRTVTIGIVARTGTIQSFEK